MGFEYLTNIPLDSAREQFISALVGNGFCPKTEVVAVADSLGRITSAPVYANICAPHYASSAMDGIAIKAINSFGATETTPITLMPDSFTVVDTGDPIPQDCDAVIMVEELLNNPDGSVIIYSSAAPWQHIRQIGEDICAGEMILASNMLITPAAIGAMLAAGVLNISVISQPIIGMIPTGDELIPPCANPDSGDILEFNSSIFGAMIKQWGGVAKTYPIVKDNFKEIQAALQLACEQCDIVLLNAGSSAGREDYSCKAIESCGTVLFHGLAIKPGKPAILGYKGNIPILGIPGYPVSGIMVLQELLKPLLELWQRVKPAEEAFAEATLTRPVVSGLKYREFVRVRMGYVGDKLMASPLSRGSGVVSSFMKADGILDIEQNCEGYMAGDKVKIKLLTPQGRLKNTLVVIGSHDPLLDELANILHCKHSSLFMSSSHVGSMGGIMALRRGEAHAAGCHLLDTQSGQYNLGFINKYFPAHNVHLIRCVGRVQGLMLQPNNPKGIKDFCDISSKGIRYVNRQKGSGTRILADYLCQKYGIEQNAIYGYEREELTHTSVAAQIACNSADVGMGIYSAAKLYDLHFLPVCVERYDLIIPNAVWDSEGVLALLETLRSDELRLRLTELGGYTVDGIGEEISY